MAAKTGKSPRGNSWAQVDALAKKIGGAKFAENADVLLTADVLIAQAKKAGKTDAQIARMTPEQLKKLKKT